MRNASRDFRIWDGKDENGFTFRENLFGIGTADAIAFFGEVVHCTVFARIDPFFENTVGCKCLARSNASQDKSQLARFVFNGLLEVGQVDLRNGYDESDYLTTIFTKIALPKVTPLEFAICHALVYSPI